MAASSDMSMIRRSDLILSFASSTQTATTRTASLQPKFLIVAHWNFQSRTVNGSHHERSVNRTAR